MGAVIEAVSGMKFSEFLKQEIFEPLGMEDTGFYVPAEKQGRFAQVYDRTEREISLTQVTTSAFLTRRSRLHLNRAEQVLSPLSATTPDL